MRRRWHPALLVLPGLLAGPAGAFESDVHLGLTQWLALQAGFEASEARAIAMGNQRVDGGLMDTLALALEYGCTGGRGAPAGAEVARQVQQRHFPADTAVPAAPMERAVEAGGLAARRALADLGTQIKGKERLMLGKFGAALHPLQDAWAHQGVPAVQPFTVAFPMLDCDARLLSGHPASHEADLTRGSPAAVLAMAEATFEALRAYPAVEGRARQAAAWPALAPQVRAFALAATKTAKREWFLRGGVADTAFLGGTSLPDGPRPGPLSWDGRKLPELAGASSLQHDAPADQRVFFDELLARWLGGERVEAVVAALGPSAGPSRAAADAASPRQLVARLALWKLQDHGGAAALAHAPAPLNAAQLAGATRLANAPGAFVPAGSAVDSVFALQPIEPPGSPLVPYIVRRLAPAAGGAPRIMAMLRPRHTPYDTLGWVAEHRGGRWVLVDVLAVVDH